MADMPKGADGPGEELEPEMSAAEMKAALKKAMETIEAQKEKIKTQKRSIKEIEDAHLKNKTLPSNKRAQSKAKSNKNTKTPKKSAGQNAKSTKKRAETSSEESDEGWNSDQSSTEESEEEKQATTLNEEDLADAVIEYCNELKKTTKVPEYKPDEIEMDKFISLHYEGCQKFAEGRTGFERHGLLWAATFIRKEMMGVFAEETEEIDPTKPENCQICGVAEVLLADDESNLRQVIFECKGQSWTLCGRVSKCQSAICLGCSNMPLDWTSDQDFWCLECNTDEKKKTTKGIEDGKTPLEMWAKPEKPPEKVTEDVQVVNVFGGGGRRVVTIAHTQRLFKMKSHQTPTIAQLNRCGTVVEVGNFCESRKCDEPRAAPRATVFVKFLKEFETDNAEIIGWNNKTMFVDEIVTKIDSAFKKIEEFKKEAVKAIAEINKHLKPRMHMMQQNLVKRAIQKIHKKMEKLSLDNIPLANLANYKGKAQKKFIAKANKIIKKILLTRRNKLLETIGEEVKKILNKETHCMGKIKAKMNNIVELMRVVRNKTDKVKFKEWEDKAHTVWDAFECDPIKEEIESSDEEPADDDNERDDMVDHAGDNEED